MTSCTSTIWSGMPPGKDDLLEVMIATYGREGIERVAAGRHPEVAGVRYLVSWQKPEGALPDELKRPDFTIFTSDTTGLSVNRNLLLDRAVLPLGLISDDDLDYTTQGLIDIIEAFEIHPETVAISFRYTTSATDMQYYPTTFSWRNPPRGSHYLTSCELAVRLDYIKRHNICFDERFGVGSANRIFIAGEEDLFLEDIISSGGEALYQPTVICRHPGLTTGQREADNPRFISTKGATFTYLFPHSWVLRMVTHTLRAKRAGAYLKSWFRGVFEVAGYYRGTLKSLIFPVLCICCVLAVAAGAGYICGNTSLTGDSLIFQFVTPDNDGYELTQPITSWQDIIISQPREYLYSNGRVIIHAAEQAVCSFLGAPMRGMINGLVWLIMIIAIGRGASYNPGSHYGNRRPYYMALSAVLCAIAFSSMDFEPPVQITYIWTGVANLVFLRFFVGTRPRHRIWIPLFALYAFICGWSSEAFSIPVSVALLVYAFRCKWHLFRSQFAGGIAYGLGTILLCIAPGNFSRFSSGLSILHTLQFLVPAIPIAIFIAATALLYYVRLKKGKIRDKRNRLSSWVVMLLTIAGVNILMAFCLGLGSGIRMLTPALMMLIMLCIRIWRRAWRGLSVGIFIAALWTAATCGGYAYTVMKVHNTKYELLKKRYHASADGTVYLPDPLFLNGYRKDLTERRSYEAVERLNDAAKPDLRILPESVKRLPVNRDTNMIVSLGKEAWIVLRSRTTPADFILDRNLDFGPFRKALGQRVLDFGNTSDIVIDSTDYVSIAVYTNERPHLKVSLHQE